MTKVAKYNIFKGISTALTFGAPIVSMLCMGEAFISRPATAISGVGVFALLMSALFLKDKLAEKFRAPSALVLSIVVFVFCVLVENVIRPLKIMALVTIIVCGVDELTFKGLYKRIELAFPEQAAASKRFGFYMAKQRTIDETYKETKT